MQSKKLSLIESITNTIISFIISMMVYPLINWVSGVQMNMKQQAISVILFTVLSIIRGYIIRRYFNRKEKPESILAK